MFWFNYCTLIISSFFFKIILLFSLHLVVRQIDWVIFHLILILNPTAVLIFGLYFIWRLIYTLLNLLGRSWMDPGCRVYFWVTIGSTCQCVLKWFFLWQGKCYMYVLSTHWGGATSAVLVAGVSLLSILQAGDWARVSTPGRHDFSFYIPTMDWHQDPVQCILLSLSEKSACW